jgi:hypothetical protein
VAHYLVSVAYVPTESKAKWNARARNHIFEALDEELFDRVFALQTAHEVWMQLKEIHVGNKKIREEKYELLKVELNEFKMKDDEGVEQMYSRMGMLIQSINALDVANLHHHRGCEQDPLSRDVYDGRHGIIYLLLKRQERSCTQGK